MKECSKIKVQNYSRAELVAVAHSSFTCRGQVFVIVWEKFVFGLKALRGKYF